MLYCCWILVISILHNLCIRKILKMPSWYSKSYLHSSDDSKLSNPQADFNFSHRMSKRLITDITYPPERGIIGGNCHTPSSFQLSHRISRDFGKYRDRLSDSAASRLIQWRCCNDGLRPSLLDSALSGLRRNDIPAWNNSPPFGFCEGGKFIPKTHCTTIEPKSPSPKVYNGGLASEYGESWAE